MASDPKLNVVTREGPLSVGGDVAHVKRRYEPPKLERYGDVNAITKAVGNKGVTPDGGTMGAQKTS